MTDPLDALRSPIQPVDPDPAFATGLRARVERALSLPRGVVVSTTTLDQPNPTDTGTATRLTPYLAVSDAHRALQWYAEVFDGRINGDPIVMPDGRIGHAEIDIGGATLFLSDQHPELGVVAPEPGHGTTVTLHAEVVDVDVLTDRAVAAGAMLERPPGDNPYGRIAVVRDPFGHRWMFNTPPVPVAAEPMREGDIAYVSWWVPDSGRAAGFFADVLGWRYESDVAAGSNRVAGATPRHGLLGGQQRSTLFLCFAVQDVQAATERVRDAGGQADEPVEQPYGLIADCVDDQGMPFALYELSGAEERPPVNGAHPGDLAYVTIHVIDSAKARAFYGSVLGWRFTPGHASDGWGAEDVSPMVGISGGHDQGTVEPMYRVDDIAAAVRRVRAAGGSATDPQAQPYGIMSECTDDQGTRFYLGQL